MTYVYFDASALSKRYVVERGSAAVNHIFARVAWNRMRVLTVGAGEVESVLVRHRNRGTITAGAYAVAQQLYSAEVVYNQAFIKVEVDWPVVENSFSLIIRHAVNATDAALLRTALALHANLLPANDDLILVACDKRLVAAARAEGLTVFDPERQTPADFDALFTA